MINFKDRLQRLKDRRQGTREQAFQAFYEAVKQEKYVALSADYRTTEAFEELKESEGIKYAIGAMAAVDKKYTDISIREGHRVADNLISRLSDYNISVDKKMQGSVALDIHIKRHSDVDMLIILSDILLYESPPVISYLPAPDKRPMKDIVKELRNTSEQVLPIRFPRVNVNTDGGKSIALEGGSLARKVDIVPSCWYDSREYQISKNEHERGIYIYHKDNHELILNYPFKHIHIVNEKDNECSGNLKCAIRLMKNVIADIISDDKRKVVKKLTSYDLTAIAFHMNEGLKFYPYMRLGLVEKIKNHLKFLQDNGWYRSRLDVPDGTRKIFDSEEKISALSVLFHEFEELTTAIFRELTPVRSNYDPSAILNRTVPL